MQSSVGSGPPGSSMSVRSVTGCPPTPSDPTTGWRVDVTLVQGATAIGSTSIPINRYGYQSGQVGLMWEGGLLVDTRATPGAATLRASCVATPEGALPEGAVASYAYEPLSFTVTNPSTGRPTTEQGAELARTGRSPWMLTLTGILSLLVGLTLIVASRRRGITSDLPRPQGRGGR